MGAGSKTTWMVTGLMVVALAATAKDPAAQRTTVCTFQDGKQISVLYPGLEKKLSFGEIEPPENEPIYLFAQTGFEVGGTKLAPKAYRVFLIPEKNSWTLIVNDDVAKGDAYSKDHDAARIVMDTGKLPAKQQDFQIVFGATGPKQCSIRVYYGETGAFTTLQEE